MKRILISLVIITMLMASFPTGVFAATTRVKSKMYEIHVVKNYVYALNPEENSTLDIS